jgi:hypothetical protein
MQRVLWTGLAGLSCLALLLVSRPAAAFRVMVGPPSVAQRVATSDVVIVGQVTGIEDKTVKAPSFPGDMTMTEYKVATIKISEALVGAKGLSHIKVGFVPIAPVRPLRPGGPFPPLFNQEITLVKGQQVCLFLRPHHKESFNVAISSLGASIDKKAPTFAKDLVEARRVAKLLAKPMASLKSRSATVRLETAALLLQRYRMFQQGAKLEPVDAEESKLILLAIANANWNVRPGPARIGQPQPVTPQGLFGQLGIQAQDGWMPPRDFRLFPAAARKWLKDNAGTFRIQRYVQATEKEK